MKARAFAADAVLRALAVGAVALAVVGCGAPSATLVSLRTQAARACERAQARGAAVKPPAVPAQTAAFLRRGIAAFGPELTGLRALRVPREQSSTYSAALGSLARELTILSGTANDLKRGADPLTAIKGLQQKLAPVEAAADAAWRTLGVPACVNR
jgi:hypothetical protein